MSRIVNETKKCCKCNAKCNVVVLESTNTFGSPDLDLRPPEMQRSTMDMWLQECPHCGYINYDLALDNGINKDFINSKQYKASLTDNKDSKYGLACKFYKFYLEMMELDLISKAYIALLHTAWCCDDIKEYEIAKDCRNKMTKLFELFSEDDKNNENIIARHIDVMRRAGKFEDIIKQYSNFCAKTDIIQKVITFQIKLSMANDDSCYRIEDCDKKPL